MHKEKNPQKSLPSNFFKPTSEQDNDLSNFKEALEDRRMPNPEDFPVELLDNLKIGFIFPGQGSQYLGMGKEFYDSERIFQEMFEIANNCSDINFIRLCFASSEQMLQGTIETQTGIFLISACIYATLRDRYKIVPDIVAGHSLGEYSAIFAAGGMSFIDALYLLHKRAQFVKASAEKQNGAMLAILGLDQQTVERVCKNYDDPYSNETVVELANYNSPTQFVVSGTRPELESIAQDVELLRGKAKFLPVNAAFHSRMMLAAEREFSPYLFKADFKPLEIPLVNNVLAQTIYSQDAIKLSIVRQTSSKIHWWKSMEKFKDCDLIVEIGPGDKLTKILQREWPEKALIAINKPSDITKLADLIREISEEKNND